MRFPTLFPLKPVSRIGVVLLGVWALTLFGQPAVSAASVSRHTATPKPTIVLVHGAFADASSWDGEIMRLQQAGYTVYAPPNPLRGVSYDSGVLRNFLKTIKGPIILVGHSYAGMVISNAATGNRQVKALVFVDAFIPEQGESANQLTNARPGSCLSGGGDPHKVFTFVTVPGVPKGDDDLYLKSQADLPYLGIAKCFANDLSPQQAAVVFATQRPAAMLAFSEPSGVPAWKTIPSWALFGTQDHPIPPAELLFMAQRAHAHIVPINASHLGLISHPQTVTNLIMSAATATR